MKIIINKLIRAADFLICEFRKILHKQPDEILHKVPYSFGKPSDCGLVCATMLINQNGRELKKEKGWKHFGLKNIIEENSNLKVSVFKRKSYLFVREKLAEGFPVIVSVKVPEQDNLSQSIIYGEIIKNRSLGNHMILCIGYDSNNFIVHDPRNIGIYKDNLLVPIKVFMKIFNGNGLSITIS